MSSMRLTRKTPGVKVVYSTGASATLVYDPGKMTEAHDKILVDALRRLIRLNRGVSEGDGE